MIHCWGLSIPRLVARHRAYKILERLRFPDKDVREIDGLYNLAIRNPGDWKLAPLHPSWTPTWESLVDIDHEPWQFADVVVEGISDVDGAY